MPIWIETSDIVAWPASPAFRVLAGYRVGPEKVREYPMPDGTIQTSPMASNAGTDIDLEIGHYTIAEIKAIKAHLDANRGKYHRLQDPRDQIVKLAKLAGPIAGETRIGGVYFDLPLKLTFYEGLI